MVLRKLKFLLKPPVPSLLGNGIVFGLLSLVSRLNGWGVAAFIVFAIYLYVSRVREHGNVGWTFAGIVSATYAAVVGAPYVQEAYAAACIGVALLVVFMGAIEYRLAQFSAALQICGYAALGLGVLWWVERAAYSGWIIMPPVFFGMVYVMMRDRVRFVEHAWNKETALWYILFAYLATQYAWGISLLPIPETHATGLFLIFFIIADEMIGLLRKEKLDKKTAIANALWYVGSSAIILLIGRLI